METFISIPVVAVDGVAPLVTTSNKNVRFIEGYGLPTTGEIAQYATAAGAITIVSDQQNTSTRPSRYLTTLTPAQILAAINAANSNVPGLGTAGDAVLVAGTVAVTIPGLTASNKVVLTRHIANTTSLTIEYQYAVTTNTLTITAAVAAGTINVADISTITYAVVA